MYHMYDAKCTTKHVTATTQRAPHSFIHSFRDPPDRHGACVTCAYAIIAHNITNTISVVNTIYYAAMCPSSVFICTHKQRLSLAHPNDFSLSIKTSSLSLSLASSWTLLADDDRAVLLIGATAVNYILAGVANRHSVNALAFSNRVATENPPQKSLEQSTTITLAYIVYHTPPPK